MLKIGQIIPLCSVLLLASACGSKEAPTSGQSTMASGSAGAKGSASAANSTAKAADAPTAAAQADLTPEAVVKSYLELGAAGDLSKIKDMVDPKCHATKVGDVDAIKMMGARMTLTEVTVTKDSETGDEAKVKYTVKGSVDAKNSKAETDIFGKKVEIKVGSMTMSGVTQSGTLNLKKIDGHWVVTC